MRTLRRADGSGWRSPGLEHNHQPATLLLRTNDAPWFPQATQDMRDLVGMILASIKGMVYRGELGATTQKDDVADRAGRIVGHFRRWTGWGLRPLELAMPGVGPSP